MNILYCGDARIARGVLISILSLVKHNKGVMHIYILTFAYQDIKPMRAKTAKVFDEIVKKKNPKSFVKLIDATQVFQDNLPERNMGTYFTPGTMLRLYMDRIMELPKDRILYLDYDVVCRGDISEFYNTDLEGYEVAGVLDIYGRYWYRPHFPKMEHMNAGVMLFNMPECVKTKMFERALDLCTHKKMMLADQAALNKVIERRKLMPLKWNDQRERPDEDTVLHHFSNNFKFFPIFRVQKVKPFDIPRVHSVLKIYEYDDIFAEYEKLKDKL